MFGKNRICREPRSERREQVGKVAAPGHEADVVHEVLGELRARRQRRGEEADRARDLVPQN